MYCRIPTYIGLKQIGLETMMYKFNKGQKSMMDDGGCSLVELVLCKRVKKSHKGVPFEIFTFKIQFTKPVGIP